MKDHGRACQHHDMIIYCDFLPLRLIEKALNIY